MIALRIRNFYPKNISLSIIGGLRVLISGSLYLEWGVREPFKEYLSLVVSETIESKVHRVTQMEIGISLVFPTKVIDLQPSELLNIWGRRCHRSPSPHSGQRLIRELLLRTRGERRSLCSFPGISHVLSINLCDVTQVCGFIFRSYWLSGHLGWRMHLINIFIMISSVCLSNFDMYYMLFAFK